MNPDQKVAHLQDKLSWNLLQWPNTTTSGICADVEDPGENALLPLPQLKRLCFICLFGKGTYHAFTLFSQHPNHRDVAGKKSTLIFCQKGFERAIRNRESNETCMKRAENSRKWKSEVVTMRAGGILEEIIDSSRDTKSNASGVLRKTQLCPMEMVHACLDIGCVSSLWLRKEFCLQPMHQTTWASFPNFWKKTRFFHLHVKSLQRKNWGIFSNLKGLSRKKKEDRKPWMSRKFASHGKAASGGYNQSLVTSQVSRTWENVFNFGLEEDLWAWILEQIAPTLRAWTSLKMSHKFQRNLQQETRESNE